MATTRSQLRTIVQAYAKSGGVSYIAQTDTDSWDTLINRGLKSYSRYTFGLYSSYTTTTTSGYNQLTTDPIWLPRQVIVAGSLLPAPTNRSFTIPYTDSGGTPYAWEQLPGSKILLYPTPNASLTVVVNGFAEHSAITVGASGDSTNISFDDVEVDDIAYWIASLAWTPKEVGSDTAPLLLRRDQIIMARIDQRRSENRAKMMGTAQRGRRSRILWT